MQSANSVYYIKKRIKIPQLSRLLNFIVRSTFVLCEKLTICHKPFEKSLTRVYNFTVKNIYEP